MKTHYEIKRISDGTYYNGQFKWTNLSRRKIYNNIPTCSNDASMLAKHFGSVIIIKVEELPNGNIREYPLKVITKK